MTETDLFKITFKTLLLAFLFQLTTNSFSQTTSQALLRDSRIKKILTFTIDGQNEPKYLSRISFVNDSGLIYRSVSLNQQQDTIERVFYEYDNLNRKSFYKAISGHDSIVTCSYEYLDSGSIKSKLSFFGNTSNELIKTKSKKRKIISYYYANDKLIQTVISKKNRNYLSISINRVNQPKKTKCKDYFDASGNITKTIATTLYEQRTPVGGYTIENADGKVEKDRTKYVTCRHKDVRLTTFEYDQLNFRIKVIYHPNPDYSRPYCYFSGQKYSCYIYEYLKD